MGDRWLAIGSGRDGELKDAILILGHTMGGPVPFVYEALDGRLHAGCRSLTEVTDKGGLDGIGSPLPVDDGAVLLHPQPKELGPLSVLVNLFLQGISDVQVVPC